MSTIPPIPAAQAQSIVDAALAEDLGWGDATTDYTVTRQLTGGATFLAKGSGVVAGLGIASLVFHRVDPSLDITVLLNDGSRVRPRDVIGRVSGSVASILKAERTALNFLQRLSGIASTTANYVDAVAGLPVRILDTRKTTPGLRVMEKYAVRIGGGHNHRMHLGDAVLMKDNHLAALARQKVTLREAIRRIRQNACHLHRIEVETTTLAQVREALKAGADVIMLDNMTVGEMQKAVKLVAGKTPIEASGNVTLDNIREIAETGVDFISVGVLTHSSPILNISLELEP